MTDRELDALVAEKVMGARWFGTEGADPPSLKVKLPRFMVYVLCLRGGEPNMPDWDVCGRPEIWNDSALDEIPHYSTDIKAAWEVVEKMRADGFVGEFVQDVPDGASARFWDNPLFEAFTETKMPADDTLPLAICLAALRAKGVKV